MNKDSNILAEKYYNISEMISSDVKDRAEKAVASAAGREKILKNEIYDLKAKIGNLNSTLKRMDREKRTGGEYSEFKYDGLFKQKERAKRELEYKNRELENIYKAREAGKLKTPDPEPKKPFRLPKGSSYITNRIKGEVGRVKDAGVAKYKEMQAQGKENVDYRNRSRMYASEFLKGEQSYQDLNKRYGVDDTEMYNLLKKARIPVTAFGMYRGKGSGIDVYKDYINKYNPAPIQKLGRGIKSFANYFRGKKKPEA